MTRAQFLRSAFRPKPHTAQWLATCGLIAALAGRAGAQEPAFLVRDVNPAPLILSSVPRELTTIGATTFFVAQTPGIEAGLWRTDGTAAGTALVKDVVVIDTPVAVGDVLFFVGFEASTGLELWKSDGTEAGTTLVKDIAPGPASAFDSSGFSNQLTAVGTTLFFTAAADPQQGPMLWKSDGTEAGTVLVAAMRAEWLAAVGGTLFFAGYDDAGAELWRSDGTPDGTVRVKDINPGPDNSEPLAITDVGGRAVFAAHDPAHGRELWISDGTAEGTVLVRDINPGSADSFPDSFTPIDGVLFFFVDVGGELSLWKSDGTETGTVLVKRVPSPGYTAAPQPRRVGTTLFFVQAAADTGVELWKSDGTEAGTVLVRDIAPGPTSSTPGALTDVDGTLFFIADDGTHGYELWSSDGTEAGTRLVRDVNPGPASSNSAYSETLAGAGGVLLFAADDGVHGMELWRSDGTTAGTVLLEDVSPIPATASSAPRDLTALGQLLLFTAADAEHGRELWRTEGSAASTSLVKDIGPGSGGASIAELTVMGGRVFFTADDFFHGRELWGSNGTEAGTELVRDIRPGPMGASPSGLTVFDGALYFSADDGHSGSELWRSDGTAAGTVQVADLWPGSRSSSPAFFTEVDGALYFTAANDFSSQLWRLDAGAAAPALLISAVYARALFNAGGALFFTDGYNVYRSDGTAEGTVHLGFIHPASGEYTITNVTPSGDRLFFTAQGSGRPVELWTTEEDGLTPLPGTGDLGFLRPPAHLVDVNGILFFSGHDATHGVELWKSDGTEAGTEMVSDIEPGPDGSSPGALSAIDGRVVFHACDASACRVEESDGSEAGTHAISGPFAALGGTLDPPGPFVRAGSLIFFPAGDVRFGTELWAVPVPDAAPCVGDCDGNRVVTVAEIVSLVGAALGTHDPACAVGDAQAAPTTIDQLVAAVRNALNGCP